MEPVSSVSQELICKAKAAEFLNEREHCNNNYAYYWACNYVGFALNTNTDKLEFMCWIKSTYSPSVTDYRGVMITENSDKSHTIINTLKTKWKGVKTEDENENDTIAALILGIRRLEDANYINFQPNYLAIHEALVSPQHYDIETNRSQRASLLEIQPCHGLAINIKNVNVNPTSCNTLTEITDICYLLDTQNYVNEPEGPFKYK